MTAALLLSLALLVSSTSTPADETCSFEEAHLVTVPEGFVVFRAGKRTSKTKEVWWPFLDGKKGKKQDWIGLVYFRPGTDELIFWTQPGAKIQNDGAYNRGKQVLLSGKKKGKKWEDAGSLFPIAFSGDGSVAATSVMQGGLWHVLLAGPKRQVASKLGSMMMMEITLSPDGKRWAADGKDMPRMMNHILLSDGELDLP